MAKQIIVIQGGDSFNTYKEYISSLKNWEVTIDKFRHYKDWKVTLPQKLGKSYDVLMPRMPNKTNARYEEWKIWFERMFPFLNGEVILIGHSLGGMFLAKYLAENDFPKRIKKLFLIASPHNRTEDIGDFLLPKSLKKISEQTKNIYLFHSKDDPSVPFSELAAFRKQLPKAKAIIFKDRGHFNQKEFPELIRLIKQQ
ncbi:MAG: hypothetical protein CEN90_543 [Parcubacteria group bacterium Licking1014_17]|nr:MAG: hypothetical protein CEN90_543 [Parcubacteria group bacterium Licking1014_17]